VEDVPSSGRACEGPGGSCWIGGAAAGVIVDGGAVVDVTAGAASAAGAVVELDVGADVEGEGTGLWVVGGEAGADRAYGLSGGSGVADVRGAGTTILRSRASMPPNAAGRGSNVDWEHVVRAMRDGTAGPALPSASTASAKATASTTIEPWVTTRAAHSDWTSMLLAPSMRAAVAFGMTRSSTSVV
jgi:hypothetical protein